MTGVTGVECLAFTLVIIFRRYACPGAQNVCEHEILVEHKGLL